MAKISCFSFLDAFKELSLCVEFLKYRLICDSVTPFDVAYSPETPHFHGINLVFKNFGQSPRFAAVSEYREDVTF